MSVNEIRRRINELSELIREFDLEEATIEGDSWLVSFRKPQKATAVMVQQSQAVFEQEEDEIAESIEVEPARPKGTPVSSPMTGVYYGSPNPSAPPFVKPGDSVTAGQVVGLVEAMKVFNEIVAPTSGTVSMVVAQPGQIVQPGDPLLYIE